jgi:hypothetical protein
MAWIRILVKLIYMISSFTVHSRVKKEFEVHNYAFILFRYILEGLTIILNELIWLA